MSGSRGLDGVQVMSHVVGWGKTADWKDNYEIHRFFFFFLFLLISTSAQLHQAS